jgi:hypothetical protein
MKKTQDLRATVSTRLTPNEAADWAEYAEENKTPASLLLRDLIRRELTQRHFTGTALRERVASEQVLELFAETMAMSLEGQDFARFMEIVERIAPDSEFVRRAALEGPVA